MHVPRNVRPQDRSAVRKRAQSRDVTLETSEVGHRPGAITRPSNGIEEIASGNQGETACPYTLALEECISRQSLTEIEFDSASADLLAACITRQTDAYSA